MKPIYILFLTAALWFATSALADTTFTYQGRLDSGGQPYSGTASMDFRLFAESTGGSALAENLGNSVQVTDGLFQADLDFGDQPYGDGLWLDITVNDQVLEPRQAIRAAPLAIHALGGGGHEFVDRDGEDVTIPAGESRFATASCEPGEQLVSGGGLWLNGGSSNAPDLHIVHSFHNTGTEWGARGYNGTAVDQPFRVVIVCAG